MKPLLLGLLCAAALNATPITFSFEGAYTPIDDGIFVYLMQWNYGPTIDRTVIITASEPITEFHAYFDNLPFGLGSGFDLSIDGVHVLTTGIGEEVTRVLSISSLTSFTTVTVATNYALGWYERANILRLGATPAQPRTDSPAPEPASVVMIAAGLAAIGWAKRHSL